MVNCCQECKKELVATEVLPDTPSAFCDFPCYIKWLKKNKPLKNNILTDEAVEDMTLDEIQDNIRKLQEYRKEYIKAEK